MALKLYNTFSRKKEVFKPKRGKKVNLFVCGPTTYDFSHLGHARTYIFFDLAAKYLAQKGYKVFYLQNITDIDDKIIARAKQNKIPWKKLARNFEKEYLKDMKTLNVNSVNKYARATVHIKEILKQVKLLLKNGYAYKIKDGIYYDISKFEDYGKLSKRTALLAQDAVSRIDESLGKKNKGDFCLWKFSKPGEPVWDFKTGLPVAEVNKNKAITKGRFNTMGNLDTRTGRPGWHIEDTAITNKFFGPQYDVHGGARDLIFPHHEAEIAQMEAISGKKPLVKYWLHTGFLTVKGQKMAKSLGNFITIRDFLKKDSPRVLRLLVLKTHYRSPIDYSDELLFQTKQELTRIDEFLEKLKNIAKKQNIQKIHSRKFFVAIASFKKRVEMAMEDDFNTPKAIAVIFSLITQGNRLIAKNELASTEAKKISDFLRKIDEILSFIFWKKQKEKLSSGLLDQINQLIKLREKYRKQKNWKAADQIRTRIGQLGWQIDDTPQGPKIKKTQIKNFPGLKK